MKIFLEISFTLLKHLFWKISNILHIDIQRFACAAIFSSAISVIIQNVFTLEVKQKSKNIYKQRLPTPVPAKTMLSRETSFHGLSKGSQIISYLSVIGSFLPHNQSNNCLHDIERHSRASRQNRRNSIPSFSVILSICSEMNSMSASMYFDH